MHPLEALGLDREADERAVKRAYAQRLKRVRPDEDPAGFQALHETYQAALAHLRWRAEWGDTEDEQEEAEDDEPEGAVTVLSADEFAALIGTQRYVPPQPTPPSLAASQDAVPREEPEPFHLDVDDFLGRLDDRLEWDDAAALRSWLRRETATWPLAFMPAVAPRILRHMLAPPPDLRAAQLEVVAEVFGLDDVLTTSDPLGLHQLRERLRVAEEFAQRTRRFAHLWRPENRSELCRIMRQPERGGYRAYVTRTVAYLLTSSRAYEWAFALRPVPFATRIVTGFLRHLDDGRFDALGPPIDAMAVEFWEWADMRRERNRPFRYVAVIVLLLLGLSYVSSKPPANQGAPGVPAASSQGSSRSRTTLLPPQRDLDALERLRRIIAIDAGRIEEAIAEYDKLIAETQPPFSNMMERVAVSAAYNRALLLTRQRRVQQAVEAYEELDRQFLRSKSREVGLVVAKARVNLGRLQFEAGDHAGAEQTYAGLMSRGNHDGSDYDLELQIAKALLGRCEALGKLGRVNEAVRVCGEALERQVSDATRSDMERVRQAARAQKRRLEPPI